MKNAAYFKIDNNQKEKGYYLIDDVIWFEYEFNKKERRIICTRKYNHEEEMRINSEKKQLNLW